MIVQKMRCYFLYSVPVTERLICPDGDQPIGVSQPLLDRLAERFQVGPADVPAFYTHHYRTEHTPYLIADAGVPQATYVSRERLTALDFFADLPLAQDLPLRWEFMLPLQGTGLITLCLEIEGPLPSDMAYRLGGLYLNPAYTVVATGPIQALWSEAQAPCSEFVTLDDLARAIHTHFFRQCGLEAHRHRALRHEIQIPFTAVEVETECKTQQEFLEREGRDLAELVFRPACWEVERASQEHARTILDASRIWSVAKDTLLVAAYDGSVYVKIKTFATGVAQEVSGFWLADERSVLHSFKVAVSNYHFLRILDDLLDEEMSQFVRDVEQHQRALRGSTENDQALADMEEFVVEVSRLRFRLIDLLDEIDNSDKLIDEEWHIALLDKLNTALGTRVWYNSVKRRIASLQDLVQSVETTYEKRTDLSIGRHIEGLNAKMLQMTSQTEQVEDRLRRAQPFFEALAAVEALNLLINIWFDPDYAMIGTLSRWLNLQVSLASRLAGTLLVLLALLLTIQLIRWLTNPHRDDA